jgi:hypothetical protein
VAELAREKKGPTIVPEGGTVIDASGRVLYSSPRDREKKGPTIVPEGGTAIDAGGRVLYSSPRADEAMKAERTAIGKARGEAKVALPDAVSTAEETVGILDQLRNHPGLDAGTGATAPIATRVWGSDAYDFEQMREQAQGTAFLTAIGKMRGTGAISNVEGEAATQAVARMRGAASKQAFLSALDDYERVVRKGLANTYTNAGLEVPPGLLRGPRRQRTAGEGQAGATAAPQTPSAAPEAPGGLSEGAILRDTQSGEQMRVVGGKLVPLNAQPSPAASAGAQSAQVAAAAPAPPVFKGPWTSDRRALIASPTPEARQAFDARYGQGKAQQVLRDEEYGQRPPTIPRRGLGTPAPMMR